MMWLAAISIVGLLIVVIFRGLLREALAKGQAFKFMMKLPGLLWVNFETDRRNDPPAAAVPTATSAAEE